LNGTVDTAISESKTVGTKMLFGLEDIQITANIDEGTKTAPSIQFFIFTKVKNKLIFLFLLFNLHKIQSIKILYSNIHIYFIEY